MNRFLLLSVSLLIGFSTSAQKKPLDHSVYDGWQSIGEKAISNHGKYVVYTVTPQEGDAMLYLKESNGKVVLTIPRGYGAAFSSDNAMLVCKIKPSFTATRDAKIKKKKPEEMPKDSLAIFNLTTRQLTKIAQLKQYRFPEEGGGGWLAYWLEKPLPITTPAMATPDSLTRLNKLIQLADSLSRAADSVRKKANDVTTIGLSVLKPATSPRGNGNNNAEPIEEGTELVLSNYLTGKEYRYPLVAEWMFSKKGNSLLYEKTRKNSDAKTKNSIHLVNLNSLNDQTILTGFNDAKSYVMDEDGNQVAFVAEKDSSAKALQKFYQLYHFKTGNDSAQLIATRNSPGMPTGYIIAESAVSRNDQPFRRMGGDNMFFSKSGKQLFFGTALQLPPKDTSLPEFERVSVDIWHYNDDQIQPAQLRSLSTDLNRSFLARYDFSTKQVIPLGNTALRTVWPTAEGEGNHFYASCDTGKRIASQWQGYVLNDLYRVNPQTGNSTLIEKNVKASLISPSVAGDKLVWYDEPKKTYYHYDALTGKTNAFAKDIPYPLYDEENDLPDDPNAEGWVKWTSNDQYLLLYDKYDIWKVDPSGKEKSVCLTKGRSQKIQYRFIATDRDEKYFSDNAVLLLRIFDEKDKSSGLATLSLATLQTKELIKEPVSVSPSVVKAKNAPVYLFTKETFKQSPDVYALQEGFAQERLSEINPQQQQYNWGTASLFKWKAYTGKETEGILYKPENFDPTKKYPMIVYFYERNSNTLHNYLAPSPTPSRLNIPFFVSRGYVVFVPDIWYKTGYPGQGGYDYIMSGTRAVVKEGYVDSTRMGLQGQSWGGFQIVYLITKTSLFRAAWAGAPVANMTSAYGGVRWGPGIVRQFQYEKSQSRIGATLWEKPELYIKNSALFSLPKVTTPLVIMANDADDAVPWYQGIEMYAGMRRLGKKVWMLNYNNEVHNLAERKNRKDIQIREQQFFDYLLKGDAPAKWIKDGVPAIMKGRDWGLGY